MAFVLVEVLPKRLRNIFVFIKVDINIRIGLNIELVPDYFQERGGEGRSMNNNHSIISQYLTGTNK